MRVGVVGLGFMGSTHLQAYEKIDGVTLAAVASSDEKKLAGDLSGVGGNLSVEARVLDFGEAKRYRNPEDLFNDPKVDAVDLCVPTHLHLPLVEKALLAGKHVLVEKPMGLTVAECQRMLDLAKQSGKVLMVAQVLRFWPEYVEARRLVRSGDVGELLTASFRRRCAAPKWGAWLQEESRSGGGAFDLLIHDFDFAIHLMGTPVEVTGQGLVDVSSHYDQLEARVEFASGKVATVSGGWFSNSYPFGMEFTISGERGVLEFHSESRPLTRFPADGEPAVCKLPAGEAFEAEMRAFADACQAGRSPDICPADESALAVRLTLAALESRARGGCPIRL